MKMCYKWHLQRLLPERVWTQKKERGCSLCRKAIEVVEVLPVVVRAVSRGAQHAVDWKGYQAWGRWFSILADSQNISWMRLSYVEDQMHTIDT